MSYKIDKVLFANSRIVETIAGFSDDEGISMAGPGVLVTWSNFGLLVNHLEFYVPESRSLNIILDKVEDLIKSKVMDAVVFTRDLNTLDESIKRNLVGIKEFLEEFEESELEPEDWYNVISKYESKHVWQPSESVENGYLLYCVNDVWYVITLSRYMNPVKSVAELSVKNNLRSLQAVGVQISGRKYTEIKTIERLDNVRLFLTVNPNEVLHFLTEDMKCIAKRKPGSVPMYAQDACMWIEIWLRYAAYLKDIEKLEDEFLQFICDTGAVTFTTQVSKESEELPNAFSNDKNIYECLTNMPYAEQYIPHMCPQDSTSLFDSEDE